MVKLRELVIGLAMVMLPFGELQPLKKLPAAAVARRV
jgi:hypothetical protein